MKICIIDSHPVTHYGINSMLNNNSQMLVVNNSYFSAEAFFNNQHNLDAQLIIIGLHIADIDSFNLLTYIHARIPSIKTILYSCLFNKEVILKTIHSGANGIISKSVDKNCFINGLSKVISSDIFVSIGNETPILNIVKSLQNKTIQLTHREHEILDMVTEGIKNKEIASILNISVSTVEFHRKNIYSKYSVTNLAELLTKAQITNLV